MALCLRTLIRGPPNSEILKKNILVIFLNKLTCISTIMSIFDSSVHPTPIKEAEFCTVRQKLFSTGPYGGKTCARRRQKFALKFFLFCTPKKAFVLLK